MEKLYIVIPAYNERENIRRLVEDWYPVVERHGGAEGSRLLVVNDGSRDDTYEILCQMAKTRPYLIPLTKENGGHGPAVLCGYRYAVRSGADYVFQTDADGQTLASEFGPFWARRKKYDMVIGYRKHRGDGLSRILVSRVLKLVILLDFHVWIRDANTPYRLMKAETLKRCLRMIPREYNLPNVLICVICRKKRLSVRWLPITFRPRQGGKNSLNVRKIVRIGRGAAVDFWRLGRTLFGNGVRGR